MAARAMFLGSFAGFAAWITTSDAFGTFIKEARWTNAALVGCISRGGALCAVTARGAIASEARNVAVLAGPLRKVLTGCAALWAFYGIFPHTNALYNFKSFWTFTNLTVFCKHKPINAATFPIIIWLFNAVLFYNTA
jgi:hypothetical protein